MCVCVLFLQTLYITLEKQGVKWTGEGGEMCVIDGSSDLSTELYLVRYRKRYEYINTSSYVHMCE